MIDFFCLDGRIWIVAFARAFSKKIGGAIAHKDEDKLSTLLLWKRIMYTKGRNGKCINRANTLGSWGKTRGNLVGDSYDLHGKRWDG